MIVFTATSAGVNSHWTRLIVGVVTSTVSTVNIGIGLAHHATLRMPQSKSLGPTVIKPRPCAECVEVRDSPLLYPVHVVRPQDGTPRLWDIHFEAVSPTCSTRWRSVRRGNTAEIVG